MAAFDFEGAYRLMVLGRRFDEACTALLAEGRPVPHYHSGVGQEALLVGSATPLRADDILIYTHRGYAQLLAKGVSLREIALDMFLKAGGTNHGRGGVMHVNRPDLGLPGREGVFGTRFGMAAGFGLASRLRGDDRVVVVAYGEAAGARGPLYEALNMAVLWRLPVVFLAEHNGWSFTTRTEWIYPNGSMVDAWRGFGIPVEVVDGNDVEAVHDTVAAAVARARAGEGPSVVEGRTYRLDPHIWWDDASYQPAEEIEQRRLDDPLPKAAAHLDAAVVEEADRWARAEVAAALAAVDEASEPTWDLVPAGMARR